MHRSAMKRLSARLSLDHVPASSPLQAFPLRLAGTDTHMQTHRHRHMHMPKHTNRDQAGGRRAVLPPFSTRTQPAAQVQSFSQYTRTHPHTLTHTIVFPCSHYSPDRPSPLPFYHLKRFYGAKPSSFSSREKAIVAKLSHILHPTLQEDIVYLNYVESVSEQDGALYVCVYVCVSKNPYCVSIQHIFVLIWVM